MILDCPDFSGQFIFCKQICALKNIYFCVFIKVQKNDIFTVSKVKLSCEKYRGDIVNKNVKKMALTGVFSAMIFVMTYFIKVPVASGYVHFGDALIYICAGFIGGPWAMLAGAIGAGLADLIGGYAIYAPATIIIKALIAIPFVLVLKNKEKLLTPLSALMTIPAGLITVGGYFAADMIIDKTYAVVDIPGNAIQAVGSAVIFIVLALAFDTVKIKKRLNINS